jgi:hypothetical protein
MAMSQPSLADLQQPPTKYARLEDDKICAAVEAAAKAVETASAAVHMMQQQMVFFFQQFLANINLPPQKAGNPAADQQLQQAAVMAATLVASSGAASAAAAGTSPSASTKEAFPRGMEAVIDKAMAAHERGIWKSIKSSKRLEKAKEDIAISSYQMIDIPKTSKPSTAPPIKVNWTSHGTKQQQEIKLFK